MKWISTLKPMRSLATFTTATVLFALSGASYSQDSAEIPPYTTKSVQSTAQEARQLRPQPGANRTQHKGPLEFEIDPERVKSNQEVLNELYRNVYRYDSGVFNYEKKIN